MSLLRRQLPWVVFVVVLMGYGMHWFPIGFQATNYAQTIIAQGLATSIILLSFVVVTGMGGMVSLAQATFVTAGGFAAGWALDRNWGINVPFIASHGQLNFFWAVIIGAVVAAAIGVLIALAATRLGAVYLALWSLAACFFFSLVPFDTQAIGQGQLGWTIRDPALDLFGWHLDFGDLTYQILLFIAVFGLIALVIHLLLHSATGRATLAVRSSPTAALAAGIRVNRNRVLIFAISAAIAGVGGVMLSLFSFAASNSTAPPLDGLVWLAFAVVFGVRRPGGALLAGLAVAAGTPILNEIATVVPGTVVHTLISSPYFLPILFGMGAITLAQAPDGVLALSGTQNLLRRRAKERAREQRAAEAAAAMSVDGAAAAGSATTDGTAIAGPVPMPEGAGVVDGAAMADRTVVTNGAERTTPAPVREPVSSEATFAAQGIVAGYDDAEVLHGVGLELRSGQIVALLGANGAGKSTFCSVLAGTLQPSRGTVYLKGTDVTAWPSYRRARAGVDMVPEARGIFPGLSVEENLALALPDREERERAYERFPVLGQRRNQTAGVLSGGEQQMLALAPALAKPPAVLIADEPTLGLAPLAAEEVIRAIVELKDLGAAVLLVEENAENALRLGNQLVFMELGNITWTGTPAEMDVGRLSATYLGGNESEPLGTR